jgi:hypothetical protein
VERGSRITLSPRCSQQLTVFVRLAYRISLNLPICSDHMTSPAVIDPSFGPEAESLRALMGSDALLCSALEIDGIRRDEH